MPLDNKQKQANRNAALNEIARSLGYETWGKFATAVKKGEITINITQRGRPARQTGDRNQS